jgi:ATP dependent DNA ligase domain/DNA ligase OB-like domain
MTISKIIKELQDNSSTNVKQKILEENKDNSLLMKVFKMTEEPSYNYYLKVDPLSYTNIPDGNNKLDETLLEEILDNLNGRRITGNTARDYVASVLRNLNKQDRNILIGIINRDLNCKVAIGLVNRVWKNLISEMPCMLASKMDEKIVKTIVDKELGYFIQTKMDGGRAMAIVKDGEVTFLSRNGKELQLHGFFNTILQNCEGYVVDGELVVRGETGIEDRQTGNGYFTKAVRGTIKPEEARKFHYVVWDLIPINDFFAGYCAERYQDRYVDLMLRKFQWNPDIVSIVDTKVISSLHEANKYYQEMLSKGEEGAILKFIDAPWENKRSKYMIKLKEEKDIDAEVIDVFRHSKKKDWIGSLLCRTRDGKVEFEVGSGFTDEDRQKHPNFYLGKIVECKYNMLIDARGRDTKSLFLPVFIKVRDDKTVANSLEELK